MALSTVIKNFRDLTSVTFKDGTGTPLECTPPYCQADLSLSGLGSTSANGKYYDYVAIKPRGDVASLRKTNQREPQVTITFYVADMYNTATNSLNNFIHRTGATYSAAVSTTAATGDVFTCDIVCTVEGTNHGDSADQTITLEDVEIDHDFQVSEDGNTFSVTGTVHGSITFA